VSRVAYHSGQNFHWPAPWCAVDGWPHRGKPPAVCQPTWPTEPLILLGSINEIVSWTKAFTMRMVVPPGECLQVKADMVLFADNTVWSMSEGVRGVHEDALYKSTLPVLLPLPYVSVSHNATALSLTSWWWHTSIVDKLTARRQLNGRFRCTHSVSALNQLIIKLPL